MREAPVVDERGGLLLTSPLLGPLDFMRLCRLNILFVSSCFHFDIITLGVLLTLIGKELTKTNDPGNEKASGARQVDV